jgi:hypothetical protein
MCALFDQLFPRQQELHADLEVAVLDCVTESVDLGPYALRVGQSTCRCGLLRSQKRQRRMEPLVDPSGCTRWQSVANATPPKTAQTSENRCRATRCLSRSRQ